MSRGEGWFGLVWCGLVWFDLVWFGLVWFGLVWWSYFWCGGGEVLWLGAAVHWCVEIGLSLEMHWWLITRYLFVVNCILCAGRWTNTLNMLVTAHHNAFYYAACCGDSNGGVGSSLSFCFLKLFMLAMWLHIHLRVCPQKAMYTCVHSSGALRFLQ
jgi:hypothetical protein